MIQTIFLKQNKLNFMTKRSFNGIALFAIITTVLMACTPAKPTASATQQQKIVPKFDYSPKVTSKVGSSNITIALVSPTYGDPQLSMNPFEDMRKSMANDFEELLTSKGFKVRGPFNQIGEMLYNDKQNSDFIFLVDIDLNFKNIDRKYKVESATNWGGVLLGGNAVDSWFVYFGDGTITCNLTLTATSSSFGEKLWKKNISLTPIPFKYEGKQHWSSPSATLLDEVQKDNTVYNEISRVLEKQYNAIFELVEKQVEVDEMKSVSDEAHKVDKKK